MIPLLTASPSSLRDYISICLLSSKLPDTKSQFSLPRRQWKKDYVITILVTPQSELPEKVVLLISIFQCRSSVKETKTFFNPKPGEKSTGKDQTSQCHPEPHGLDYITIYHSRIYSVRVNLRQGNNCSLILGEIGRGMCMFRKKTLFIVVLM